MHFTRKRAAAWLAAIAAAAVAIGGVASATVASSTPSDYNALTSYRLLDTRVAPATALKADTPMQLTVGGVDGVPATASAVTVNLTVTGATSGGYLLAWPDGATKPAKGSNVNFNAGQTVGNLATVPMTDGKIDIEFLGAGSTQVVVDLEGYYTASAAAYSPPAAITATLTVPSAGEAIATGGSFSKNATEIGTITFPAAGTYQINTSFVATPDENTSGTVYPELLFLDAFNAGGTPIEPETSNADLTGTPQNPMSLDLINTPESGTSTVTVTAGETLTVDGFGYDGDTGAGSYWLFQPQVTAIPLTVAAAS
jgi:hypothetical protein